MAEAGGTLEAGPADGGGFRVIARLPIAAYTNTRSETAPEHVAPDR
jgi:hypothetical protein